MATAVQEVMDAVPQYSPTFESYCDALIKGMLDPDDFTLAFLKTIDAQMERGERPWKQVETAKERKEALANVERVARAIGYKQGLREKAAKESKQLLRK